MRLIIKYEPWDSEKFGLKIGSVFQEGFVSNNDLDQLRKEAISCGYKLLYLKGICIDECYLSDSLKLVDKKVVFNKSSDFDYSFSDPHIISIINAPINDQILSIALQSGIYSRYRCDMKMPYRNYEILYTEWITRSLSGEIATNVYAFYEEKSILGLITYRHDGLNSSIGLLGVDKESRGKGIGTKLLKTVCSQIANVKGLNVSTQLSNEPACSLYKKNGFSIKSITNIYHLWL